MLHSFGSCFCCTDRAAVSTYPCAEASGNAKQTYIVCVLVECGLCVLSGCVYVCACIRACVCLCECLWIWLQLLEKSSERYKKKVTVDYFFEVKHTLSFVFYDGTEV